LEQILGRFVDASYAYRFGPPGHEVIAASLHRHRGDIPFAQSFRFPAGRTDRRSPVAELGLEGHAKPLAGGAIEMLITTRRLAWGVRATACGFMADDAYFGIEPSRERRIVLTPLQPTEIPANIAVTAVNAEGRISVAVEA
jgi:beta-mannosidase